MSFFHGNKYNSDSKSIAAASSSQVRPFFGSSSNVKPQFTPAQHPQGVAPKPFSFNKKPKLPMTEGSPPPLEDNSQENKESSDNIRRKLSMSSSLDTTTKLGNNDASSVNNAFEPPAIHQNDIPQKNQGTPSRCVEETSSSNNYNSGVGGRASLLFDSTMMGESMCHTSFQGDIPRNEEEEEIPQEQIYTKEKESITDENSKMELDHNKKLPSCSGFETFNGDCNFKNDQSRVPQPGFENKSDYQQQLQHYSSDHQQTAVTPENGSDDNSSTQQHHHCGELVDIVVEDPPQQMQLMLHQEIDRQGNPQTIHHDELKTIQDTATDEILNTAAATNFIVEQQHQFQEQEETPQMIHSNKTECVSTDSFQNQSSDHSLVKKIMEENNYDNHAITSSSWQQHEQHQQQQQNFQHQQQQQQQQNFQHQQQQPQNPPRQQQQQQIRLRPKHQQSQQHFRREKNHHSSLSSAFPQQTSSRPSSSQQDAFINFRNHRNNSQASQMMNNNNSLIKQQSNRSASSEDRQQLAIEQTQPRTASHFQHHQQRENTATIGGKGLIDEEDHEQDYPPTKRSSPEMMHHANNNNNHQPGAAAVMTHQQSQEEAKQKPEQIHHNLEASSFAAENPATANMKKQHLGQQQQQQRQQQSSSSQQLLSSEAIIQQLNKRSRLSEAKNDFPSESRKVLFDIKGYREQLIELDRSGLEVMLAITQSHSSAIEQISKLRMVSKELDEISILGQQLQTFVSNEIVDFDFSTLSLKSPDEEERNFHHHHHHSGAGGRANASSLDHYYSKQSLLVSTTAINKNKTEEEVKEEGIIEHDNNQTTSPTTPNKDKKDDDVLHSLAQVPVVLLNCAEQNIIIAKNDHQENGSTDLLEDNIDPFQQQPMIMDKTQQDVIDIDLQAMDGSTTPGIVNIVEEKEEEAKKNTLEIDNSHDLDPQMMNGYANSIISFTPTSSSEPINQQEQPKNIAVDDNNSSGKDLTQESSESLMMTAAGPLEHHDPEHSEELPAVPGVEQQQQV